MSRGLAWRAVAAVLGLTLILAPMSASGAPVPASAAAAAYYSEAGARTFVQGFYGWYAAKVLASSHRQSGFGFIDAVRQRPTWFSPELKRLLEEDVAAASKCKDDVVGLDWDPFLESQETPGSYTVGKVEKTAQGFRVSVDLKDAKARDARNPAAEADVAFVDDHWQFVDFVEEPTDPKLKQGLVAILKGYERSGEYKCRR
jgi:hypothetical protein